VLIQARPEIERLVNIELTTDANFRVNGAESNGDQRQLNDFSSSQRF
jgi:hypothetical protein